MTKSNSAHTGTDALSGFLHDLLEPSPARWRNALRLTVLCCFATVLVMGLHIPDGEFLAVFFFAVSQPDAWASLRKARLRGIGTIIGGVLGLLVIVACTDKPPLWFLVQGALFAVALFFTRTTTIPYAVILALFTFVIVTPTVMTDPNQTLEKLFWRIALTSLGGVLGTVAQLVLWPETPRRLLFQELASRLERVERILAELEVGRSPAGVDDRNHNVFADTLAHLDLLASAEAGSQWVRRRHSEHVKLILDVEALLIAATRLEPGRHDLARVTQARNDVSRFRRALHRSEAPEPNAVTRDFAHLTELERASQELESSIALAALEEEARDSLAGLGEPISPGSGGQKILTPACTLSNIEAVQFGIKGALAASICYVMYQAMDWPGISTCVVTTLIVAQTSFGAGLTRSILRIAGALLGGVMSAIIIFGFMPNMVSVASLVIVLGAAFFVAAWINAGNARVSYIGMQVGLVLCLVLLNRTGPTIDLIPAIDRVIGVLLGITVMGFIDLTLWPSFAGVALARKLALTREALAELARCVSRLDWERAEEAALTVRRRIAAARSLFGEAGMEFWAAKKGDAERRSFPETVYRLQKTLFELVMYIRECRALADSNLPENIRLRLEAILRETTSDESQLVESAGAGCAATSRALSS